MKTCVKWGTVSVVDELDVPDDVDMLLLALPPQPDCNIAKIPQTRTAKPSFIFIDNATFGQIMPRS
jgi:hypothetical protein